MSAAIDFKKTDKALYQPPKTPVLIDVPEMPFFMVDGRGNPNTGEAYSAAVELLYALTFTVKMSKMNGTQPAGYFEYVVPPLEGLWWTEGAPFDGRNEKDKSKFCWTSMIRQPDFVTEEVFEQAKRALEKKKPGLELRRARLVRFCEGLCAQVLHIGPFDDEPETIDRLNRFIAESGYRTDIGDARQHHEIYLGDPRRVAPEKRRTVIRHPVARA